MNRTEVATLLTKIAAYDRRTLGETDVEAWHDAIDERVTLRDALAVVSRHYAASKDWLMPSDVNGPVLKLRADRLRAAGTAADPDQLPGQSDDEWRMALLDHRRVIADGQAPEPIPPVRAVPAGRPGMRSLGAAMAETVRR